MHNPNVKRFAELTTEQQIEMLDEFFHKKGIRFLVEETPDYTSCEFAKDCSACGGSGYYDNDGSPTCASCDGLGIETFRRPHEWPEREV